MALPEERKENLKKLVSLVVDEDVLNEVDALTIIQICLDACEREKAEALERYLTASIEEDKTSGE